MDDIENYKKGHIPTQIGSIPDFFMNLKNRYPRHFVVYNHKYGSVRDKMTGTETLCPIYKK